MQRLQEARAYSGWPHRFRQDILNQEPEYRQMLDEKGFLGWPFVKIIRDPCRRVVSSFTSSFRQAKLEGSRIPLFFGSSPDGDVSYSFNEFLDFLSDEENLWSNIHWQPQLNELEAMLECTVINVDTSDFARSLNEFEATHGLEATDFGAGQIARELERIAIHHHLRRFETNDGWAGRRLNETGADGQWPHYSAFLNDETRTRIRRIYREDFNAYGPLL